MLQMILFGEQVGFSLEYEVLWHLHTMVSSLSLLFW